MSEGKVSVVVDVKCKECGNMVDVGKGKSFNETERLLKNITLNNQPYITACTCGNMIEIDTYSFRK